MLHFIFYISLICGFFFFVLKKDRPKKSFCSNYFFSLQEILKNKTHVIIDEYSMVSQVIIAHIDKRLCKATGKKSNFFGGLSVILVGDPLHTVGNCYQYVDRDNVTTVTTSNYQNRYYQNRYTKTCTTKTGTTKTGTTKTVTTK